jgi:hypothetical protein
MMINKGGQYNATLCNWYRFGSSLKTFNTIHLPVSVIVPEDQKQVLQRDTIVKPGLEMIGIINKRGKMTESIGFDSLSMPKSKKEMFLMKIALRASMQSDFDEYLGKVNYCMTQREDRKFISIPVQNNNTILAVIKNDCDHEELVKNITQALKNPGQLWEEILFKRGES